jgi:DNA-binding NtrC family response regulator
MPKRVMVINDTEEILALFEAILIEEGYEVSLHSYRMQDLGEIKKVNPDLIVIDQLFGNEAHGWQVIQKIHMDTSTAKIPIVVCSTELRLLKELEGHLKAKNILVVIKPFDVEELVDAVNKALNQRSSINAIAGEPEQTEM